MMLLKLLEKLGGWGYLGAFLGLVMDAACFPIPSEALLPFIGFMTWKGGLNPFLSLSACIAGCVVGATFAYFVGRKGGRPLVKRFGKYILLTESKLEVAERWFNRWGAWTVLFGRWMTGIRPTISIPAGIFKVPYPKFIAFTVVGYGAWCAFGMWLGYVLGENWEIIVGLLQRVGIWSLVALGMVVVIALAFVVYRKARLSKNK